MSHLIEKHQNSRGVIQFSPKYTAELLGSQNPFRMRSSTIPETTRQVTESKQNQQRTLATKEAIKQDNKKPSSQRIGRRVTVASTTNPEDVRTERVIGQGNQTQLTERKDNPNRRVSDEQLRQYYTNQELERRFDEEVLPATTEFFKTIMPSSKHLGYLLNTNDKRSFADQMINGNEGLGSPTVNLAVDLLAPGAVLKGLSLLRSPRVLNAAKYLTTVKFPKTWQDYMRLGPIEFKIDPGTLGANGKKVDMRLANIWNSAEKSVSKDIAEIPIIRRQYDDVTRTNMQSFANEILTDEGKVKYPLWWHYLKNNPEQMDRMKRIANGLENIPDELITSKSAMLRPYPGRKFDPNDIVHFFDPEDPQIGLSTVMAFHDPKNYARILEMSKGKEPLIMQSFRGTQPILDENLLPVGDLSKEQLTGIYGNYLYSTNAPDAAANYAHNLTHGQMQYVLDQLRHSGIPLTKQNIEYALSLTDNIIGLELDKGFKLGLHAPEFHYGLRVPRTASNRGAHGIERIGVKSVLGKDEAIDWWETPEMEQLFNNWVSDQYRYSRFFGPYQGYGGINTVLTNGRIVPWEYNAGKAYHNELVGAFKPYKNTIDGQLKNPKSVKRLQMHAENYGVPGMYIYNVYDPLWMNSYGTAPGHYLYGFGMKKGGKLLKNQKQ